MRDRLIELIRNAKAAMKAENLSCDIARNMFAADRLIANGVTVQEWVSVKDRLPEEGEDVLVYRGGGCNVEALESVSRKYWENDIFSYCRVTHWMPLPQPPEEVHS